MRTKRRRRPFLLALAVLQDLGKLVTMREANAQAMARELGSL